MPKLLKILMFDPLSISGGKRPLHIMILHKIARTPAIDAEIKIIHEASP